MIKKKIKLEQIVNDRVVALECDEDCPLEVVVHCTSEMNRYITHILEKAKEAQAKKEEPKPEFPAVDAVPDQE